MLSLIAASLALAGTAAAAGTPTDKGPARRQESYAATPLASKHIPYDQIPYQVDTDPTGRGPQFGFNLCNTTTQNQNSNCQTAYINSPSDWCLWGPPTPNSDVGDTEAASVAWCTSATHGTRVIPAGAITGLQYMKTPSYVQITGYINQQLIDMDPADGGGEMDPHGADGRGNPLGGLVYSTGLPITTGSEPTQVIEWHNFMGSNMFCFKVCDPGDSNAANYCQHVFDRIGANYNCPAAYVDQVFESCLGDNQDFPGVYTGSDGKVTTYVQPPESLGPISSMPYTARIPASSSCTTYSSAQLFSNQPSASIAVSTSGSVSASGSAATVTKASAAAAGGSSASKASASASKSANAGDAVKFGTSGVWSVAIGLVGAAIGAVVAL